MSDRGGGVPLRKIERLFSYMYSTAPSPVHSDNSRNAPLVRFTLFHNHFIAHVFGVDECLNYKLSTGDAAQ